MKPTYLIPLIIVVVVAVMACRKELPAASRTEGLGQVTYLNLSEDIKTQITNGVKVCNVLIDNNDTSTIRIHRDLDDSIPYFSQYFPLLFPYAESNFKPTIPWTKYTLLKQGQHQLLLTDTGRHPVVQLPVSLSMDIPLSVWFMDSLGTCRGLVARDVFNSRQDAAGLRVVDAAPDAGAVFFTINREYAGKKGFPDTLRYGTIIPFIQRAVAAQDTLRVRFYSVKDSVNILAKQTLVIQPGQAYSIVLTGYNQQQTYKNPRTRKWVTINPDIQVLLFKNN